ncbi:C40 family peptidase [Nicoliella lavandulae]|uniref:NlpC/P60 family protein n=1 Tax=Nicoliella lavandulae TaxID=3082954 RepID=A0ABU8SJS2_9LACO
MTTYFKPRLLAVLTAVLFATVAIFSINTISANADAEGAHPDYDKIYSAAKSKLGSPYVYGAVGPNRFDCSGFTKYVYKKANINIARTAQAQYDTTKKVSRKNLQKGDLVYFGYSKRSISHVGIYVGNGKMINAQNRGVITEKIDSPWWNTVGYSRAE